MTLAELEKIKKNYKVLEIAVDFINPSYNISRAKHLDTARYIICTLTENGIPRTVKTNEVARIRLQKPDRTYVYNDCDILEDGRVFITLTEQILAIEGNAVCDIQLTDEETGIIYSTKNFIINIDKTAVNNSMIESSNEFDALNNLIATNKKLNDELNENEEVRKANENNRVENEADRQKNETDRQNAEIERVNAENTRIINENQRIANETLRKSNETVRQTQETDREKNTADAISNAEAATKKANDAADGLQAKLDSHYFVLTDDKDVASGVPGLDSNMKISIGELYEATTTSKGITQLTDSISSTSNTTAATPNSVKNAYDKAVLAESNANSYTDTKIANLINGAPSTLDTLGEIADAMSENATVVEALNSAIGNKVDKETGKGLSSNDYTTSEKTKLAGISSNAEVNQNAFSNVLIGTTTVAAGSKTDTLTLVAGDNITITPNAANSKITISSTGSSGGDSVSFTQSLTSGTKIGTLTINGTNTDLYCQTNTNTDTKVTQTVTTTSADYPVLLAPSGQTSTTTTSSYFGSGLTFNPNTNTLTSTTFSGALSGNASSATKLNTARTIKIENQSNTFDGSGNITFTASSMGLATSSHTHNYLPLSGGTMTGTLGIVNSSIKDNVITGGNSSHSYHMYIGTYADQYAVRFFDGGTYSNVYADFYRDDTGRGSMRLYNANGYYTRLVVDEGNTANLLIKFPSHAGGTLMLSSDNAASATKLNTARTIKIGNQSNTFDGSGNITFTASSMGLATSSHTHNYLPLSGGTMTGQINLGSSTYYVKQDGSAHLSSVTATGNIIPSATTTYSNGTTANRWNVTVSRIVDIGYSSYSAGAGEIRAYWKDGALHDIISTSTDGLNVYFGWVGSSSYASISNIRAYNRINLICNSGNGSVWCSGAGFEISHATPYIDFHFAKSNTDYTARIIESSSGALKVYNTIANASDRRLKKNITGLSEKYLEVLDNLKPSEYRYVKGDRYLNLGFIAQDVEKALIEAGITDMPLISQDNNNGMYSLDYNGIIPILTLAVQKLRKEVNNLKTCLK